MIRGPAVAGSFYYWDPQMLSEQVDGFMEEDAGKEEVLGVMAPHAGFIYSGAVAGKVYSRIKPADSYVVIGPNHTGLGAEYAIVREGVFRMPSGDVQVNSDLAENMLLNSKYLAEDGLAHQREHSIEVQLPFLKHLGRDFNFVPLCISRIRSKEVFLEVAQDIGNAISAAAKKTREKVVVVASTDLTHYEPQKTAREKDGAVLDAVLALDPERLFDVVESRHVSMCGVGPTAIMLYACLSMGAKRAELAGYMTSGDVSGDFSSVVGYGGVLVK